MVRIEGSGSVPRSRRASKIASAPQWPRSLRSVNCCRRSKIRSSIVGRCALRGPRDRWLILPADAVQSLAPCLLDPVVDRRLRDAEAAGDLALGQAASDGLDDLTTALSGQALLLMVTSRRNAVSIKVTSWHAFRRSVEGSSSYKCQ